MNTNVPLLAIAVALTVVLAAGLVIILPIDQAQASNDNRTHAIKDNKES
jgi:hypothetical protein